MQADTVTTTTVTKPKPQDQDHGGDFPASEFLFPPFANRLYPYPHLSPSPTFIYIIVVWGQSPLFTKGIASWVIPGEILGFLTQSEKTTQSYHIHHAHLVSGITESWNSPLPCGGRMQGRPRKIPFHRSILKTALEEPGISFFPPSFENCIIPLALSSLSGDLTFPIPRACHDLTDNPEALVDTSLWCWRVWTPGWCYSRRW